MAPALWQVQEDESGRWRDFPHALKNAAEEQFQDWLVQGAPPNSGFDFVWPNSKMTVVTPYRIVFPEGESKINMHQINMKTEKFRPVRRIPLPEEA